MIKDMVCYLDSDGTLVSMLGGACKLFGVKEEDVYRKWIPGHYNMEEFIGVSATEFYERIAAAGANFWATLEFMPDGLEILNLVERFFGDNVILVTSPMYNASSAMGKIEFIQRNLPKYKRRYSICPIKEMFAHPNAVLIDDSNLNIRRFRERSGYAIEVGRIWNNNFKNSNRTVQDLREKLDIIAFTRENIYK